VVLLLPEPVGEPLNEGCVYVVFGLAIDARSCTALVLPNTPPGCGEPGFFAKDAIESCEAMTRVSLSQFPYMLLFRRDVYHKRVLCDGSPSSRMTPPRVQGQQPPSLLPFAL